MSGAGDAPTATIRVCLPAHLRTLAQVGMEVSVEVAGAVTIGTVLDALEARYPMLRGTIRDRTTRARRAFMRYFVCGEDWSHLPEETALPPAIVTAAEPFLVIGAIAGG